MTRAMSLVLACAVTVAAALVSTAWAGPHGLIMKSSPHSVGETIDRLEAALEERGLTIFTRIDHGTNAEEAGLSLSPAEVLIFGNPEMGTPLMRERPTAAIDLPQRVLAYEDGKGAVWLVYNEPKWFARRHDIEANHDVIEAITGALDGITDEVVR